jgi:hypothetical protein
MAETTPGTATVPAAGATPAQTPPAEPPAPPATGSDEPLGEGGKRALERERLAARDAISRAEKAEKALKDLQDAQLSEAEKRDKRLAELETSQASWETERQGLLLQAQVERLAARLGFNDPADALGLLDRKEIEFDKNGEPRNLEKLLADLLKAKPYLGGRRMMGSADAGGLTSAAPQTSFTRAQIRDQKFFETHRAEILQAAKEGHITG